MAKISGGYILKARKALDSDLMDKPPLWSKLWDWMLLRAEWRTNGKLERGQLRTSIKEMREKMSWRVGYRKEMPSIKEMRKAYEGLAKGNMVGIARGTRGMLVTIINYDRYQDPGNYERHSEGATKGKQRAHVREEGGGNKKKSLASEDRDSSCSPAREPCAHPQKRTPCPHQKIIAAYHEHLPELSTIQSFSETVKKTLAARWNEIPKHRNLEFWRSLFATVAASDFLMGRVKDWRCPGLLWIIGPKNFAKIVNGHYANYGIRTGSTLTNGNIRAGQAWLADHEVHQ